MLVVQKIQNSIRVHLKCAWDGTYLVLWPFLERNYRLECVGTLHVICFLFLKFFVITCHLKLMGSLFPLFCRG